MNNSEWIERGEQVLIHTYRRFPAAMVRGEGCRLWDENGKEYLDFLSGIAVCVLGHCQPEVTRAIRNQAGELVHVSNLFYTRPQIELAELLVRNSFADRVFFANSGAEANEAAIKLARIYSAPGKYEIISLLGSFHGRTLAAVAATGQPHFHRGFEPMPEGFINAEFGDLQALEALISPQTCAILCEPIQGESGVRPLSQDYLQGIRALCDRHGLLLIFDEVQTGLGRTGTLFAHEQLGVTPDIMTLAKALGSGLPLSAMLTTEKIAAAFTPGTHAATFGGNPVSCAAGVVVLRQLLAPGFLEAVRDTGAYFMAELQGLAEKFPQFASGARGRGLLLGLTLTEKGIAHGAEIVNRMFERGLIINFTGNQVLRFVPPLIVTRNDIDTLIRELEAVFAELA
ncbi:aspartate aminotransferase family protein [Desulfobulbus oralis]|uniref:Acetylornithine aminotransferase n=1 Tax=Desulfobulbus oralis TaxID=1986146 RepID=A0A2L1GP44_9BACT|nr:aspartate aminotransferase family protein [Desulfobulbus oralis]AVD71406.1 aspartate aminotransferase family protein [Desulfobulbus oralis]